MNTNYYLKRARADKFLTLAYISAIIFFVGMMGLVAGLGQEYDTIFSAISVFGGILLIFAYLGIKLTKRTMKSMVEET